MYSSRKIWRTAKIKTSNTTFPFLFFISTPRAQICQSKNFTALKFQLPKITDNLFLSNKMFPLAKNSFSKVENKNVQRIGCNKNRDWKSVKEWEPVWKNNWWVKIEEQARSKARHTLTKRSCHRAKFGASVQGVQVETKFGSGALGARRSPFGLVGFCECNWRKVQKSDWQTRGVVRGPRPATARTPPPSPRSITPSLMPFFFNVTQFSWPLLKLRI